MNKYKKFLLIISIVLCTGLSGCSEHQSRNGMNAKVVNAAYSFSFEDSYEFDPDLIADWTNDEAAALLDSMEKEVPADVAFIRGNLALNDGDDKDALKYFEKCIEIGDPDEDVDIVAKSLYEKAKMCIVEERYDDAKALVEKLNDMYEGKMNRDIQVRINVLWAYDVLSIPDGVKYSIELMEKTKDIAYKYDYFEMEYVLYQLASSYAYDDSMTLANHYYSEALAMAREDNNYFWISTLNTEIGVNYQSIEDYEKSLEYLNEAYECIRDNIEEDINMPFKEVYVVDEMVQAYLGMKDSAKANEKIKLEEDLVTRLSEGKEKEDYRTNYYVTLGRCLILDKKFNDGIEKFDLAIERFEAEDYFFFSSFDSYVYECYGDAYYDKKQYDKALEYYKKVEAIYMSEDPSDDYHPYMDRMYEIYNHIGDNKNSYIYAKKSIKLLKELYREKEMQNADVLLEQIKNKEKEAEIDKLKYRNNVYLIVICSALVFLLIAALLILNNVKKNRKIRALNSKLKGLSSIDELTGLNNRRSLNEFFAENWAEICQSELPISMVMLDIDYFKKYNDTYGHQAGDDVISKVASVIKRNCQDKDFVARYGGEEFLVVLPGTDIDMTVEIFEKVQNILREFAIEHSESDVSEYVTISVGIATADSGIDYLKLIHEADSALYMAKNKRNTIEAVHVIAE